MKVIPNDPLFPCTEYGDTDISISTGVPIKLEIAARFHAALLTDTNYGYQDPEDRARVALREADALINEYNKQEGK